MAFSVEQERFSSNRCRIINQTAFPGSPEKKKISKFLSWDIRMAETLVVFARILEQSVQRPPSGCLSPVIDAKLVENVDNMTFNGMFGDA